MNKKALTPNLICFLMGHDLRHYRLTYRNQTRLVCRRCYDPYTDTLLDVWQQLRQRALTRQNDSDEVPF